MVFRDDPGFAGGRDPAAASNLSNRKRVVLSKELQMACSAYIHGGLRTALATWFYQLSVDCQIIPDENDAAGQTLFVENPTLYPSREVTYMAPCVKIEAGAKSALDPSQDGTVTTHIVDELLGWSFKSGGIRVIVPEQTYWEELLILQSTADTGTRGVFWPTRTVSRVATMMSP